MNTRIRTTTAAMLAIAALAIAMPRAQADSLTATKSA